MTEQQIQTKIKHKLEQEGWYVIKLIKTSKNGIMDIICHRNGETMYIEVKKLNGKLSEIQKVRIKELRQKGIVVKVWIDFNIDFIWTT